MTLAEFLLARIAEDEAQARSAIAMRDRIHYVHPPVVPDLALEAFEDTGVPAVIVGPERVLAECEAKRRIVEALDDAVRENERGGFNANRIWGLLHAEHLLAAMHADHPDYRDEWKV